MSESVTLKMVFILVKNSCSYRSVAFTPRYIIANSFVDLQRQFVDLTVHLSTLLRQPSTSLPLPNPLQPPYPPPPIWSVSICTLTPRLFQEPEVPGSIPSPATYFRFSFR